jgi:crossover junction endodeoxyribonuclease RuvC
MNTWILGVDPGLSGAMAMLNAGAVDVFDIPTTTRTVNKKEKRQIDPYSLAAWLEIQRPLIKFAVIEQVGTMPGQGVTSAFNFGFTTGVIHGIIAACGIEIRTVPPQVWKRKYGLLGQNKDASRGEASRRFPQFTHLWQLKKHDGRAEAALLALYGSEMT